jgi:hypothetical protein
MANPASTNAIEITIEELRQIQENINAEAKEAERRREQFINDQALKADVADPGYLSKSAQFAERLRKMREEDKG